LVKLTAQKTSSPEGGKRVVVENVEPEIDCGRFPIKRAVGEKVVVYADVFCDSHDAISARLLYRRDGESGWHHVKMQNVGNDRWKGEFIVEALGKHIYTVEGNVEPFLTLQRDLKRKLDAGHHVEADIQAGIQLMTKTVSECKQREAKNKLEEHLQKIENLNQTDPKKAASAALSLELAELMEAVSKKSLLVTYNKMLEVVVDRGRALFSAWYELFPRSCSITRGEHGTFKDLERMLPELSKMGFDVLYLPPIHPIGETNRRGRNNSPIREDDSPGSPWAIGSKEGGHKSVHPKLGTLEDLERLVGKAKNYNLEIALDLAFQCSPDHPYIKEHPEWFRWLPDGTVHHAENPPKKYEDVVPFNFETENWQALWEELRSIVVFWIRSGVKIFRVDNPHTKPFSLWEWLISEVKRDYPDVIFLSEAFTRPKVMYRLAKLGFTQSYTYFTWRNSKRELTDYLNELTKTEIKEYFRPIFWTNTPDILPEYLQHGGRAAFIIRLVLAATLSSNYGIYGPPYEFCVGESLPGREEYLNSEKYEIRHWDSDSPDGLRPLIARINRIRRENPTLQTTNNLSFYEINNDNILCYGKTSEDRSNTIMVAVSLDPFQSQSGLLKLPLNELGVDPAKPYLMHDLLGDGKYIWQGEANHVELNPHIMPAQIFRVRRMVRRESDFDYFM